MKKIDPEENPKRKLKKDMSNDRFVWFHSLNRSYDYTISNTHNSGRSVLGYYNRPEISIIQYYKNPDITNHAHRRTGRMNDE